MAKWQDSGWYGGAQSLAAFLIANLISAFLLMTVIGAPFGLLGLFAIMNSWVQGTRPDFFRVYFGAVRRYWRTALALGLIDLAAGALIFTNLSVIPLMAMDNFFTVLTLTLTLSVAAVLLMANLYAWSVLSLLDLPWRGTLKLSIFLVLRYPARSLLIALATLFPLLTSLFLPIAFILLLSLSVSAYIAARGVWWVLRAQFSRQELFELMADDAASISDVGRRAHMADDANGKSDGD